jgi:RNA polymerase sigma-70 factor (ECF subfamily)
MPISVEDAVISRARQGDVAAVGRLYQTYSGPVYRYLLYRLGSVEIAEDLTAEVFLKMIKALPDYWPLKAPFRAWLFQIARNLAVDQFRKMKVRDHVNLNEELAASGESPDTIAERQLTSDRLLEALEDLSQSQRDVVVMRFVADMPIAEVAAAVGKSQSAVKALQLRGLQELRAILAEWKVTNV